jgi:hypothetical protein
MEIVELSVIQPGPGLNDLIYRLAERMGENVTGMTADVADLAIDGLPSMTSCRSKATGRASSSGLTTAIPTGGTTSASETVTRTSTRVARVRSRTSTSNDSSSCASRRFTARGQLDPRRVLFPGLDRVDAREGVVPPVGLCPDQQLPWRLRASGATFDAAALLRTPCSS